MKLLKYILLIIVALLLTIFFFMAFQPWADSAVYGQDPYPPPRSTPTNAPLPFPAEQFPEYTNIVWLPVVQQ